MLDTVDFLEPKEKHADLSFSIDIKYIDIAQNLTSQCAKMCNTLDFSKSHIGNVHVWPYFSKAAAVT